MNDAYPKTIAGLGVLAVGAVLLGGNMLLKDTPPPVVVAPTAPLTEGVMFRDCPTCPVMHVLPADPATIAYPLAAGVTEVTAGEFAEFAGEYPRNRAGCEIYDGEWRIQEAASWDNTAADKALPVTCVSWQDAVDYAAWLSLRTGQTYRLPSAPEWEYLAGAGSPAVPWKSGRDACTYANVADLSAAQRYPGWTAFECHDGFVGVAPAGSFAPNGFGLADTFGNAFEWVQDCWVPVDDGNCREHEARGGSWFTAPALVRPNYRNRFETEYRGNSLGFRLVREISR